jgi:hypothetical protein
MFPQDREATPEELSSRNLCWCPKGNETGMLRPIAVLTDHTRLDRASEACAEALTWMLWVELAENTPRLIVGVPSGAGIA